MTTNFVFSQPKIFSITSYPCMNIPASSPHPEHPQLNNTTWNFTVKEIGRGTCEINISIVCRVKKCLRKKWTLISYMYARQKHRVKWDMSRIKDFKYTYTYYIHAYKKTCNTDIYVCIYFHNIQLSETLGLLCVDGNGRRVRWWIGVNVLSISQPV